MSRGVFVTNDQVRLTGSPDVARFLAQCLYWSGIDMVEQRQGWFYKSRDEWQSETWLSRYKQEKAREQLKNMGLLQERRERRNTGIRLWFRLNRGLYNALLNGLLTEETTNKQNDSTNSKESLIDLSDCSTSSVSIDSPIDIEDKSTIVLIHPYKAENSTIVQDYICVNDDVYSDKHCLTEDLSEHTSDADMGVSVEAIASPLTPELSNRPDNRNTIDPELYLFCHPFIYQFVRSLVMHAEADYQDAHDLYYALMIDGFESDTVQQGLFKFIEVYGHDILSFYQNQSSLLVNPINRVDIDDAIRISKGGF